MPWLQMQLSERVLVKVSRTNSWIMQVWASLEASAPHLLQLDLGVPRTHQSAQNNKTRNTVTRTHYFTKRILSLIRCMTCRAIGGTREEGCGNWFLPVLISEKILSLKLLMDRKMNR